MEGCKTGNIEGALPCIAGGGGINHTDRYYPSVSNTGSEMDFSVVPQLLPHFVVVFLLLQFFSFSLSVF